MDERPAAECAGQATAHETTVVEKTSARYVGRWNRLVSTTNWEKGRIISEWRKSLMEAGAPTEAYSDEAWSRRAGNVSPQHVGRLRRVYERFGQVYKGYRRLHWSHFYAGLDWDDAEMWLEGAVQNGWSVAQMRATRWEAMGAPPHKKPKPEDVILAELDEDVDPALDEATGATLAVSTGVVQDLRPDGASRAGSGDAESHARSRSSAQEATTIDPFRPFEDLPPLPDDLAAAFEAFKLAILNHKLSGWQEVSCEQVLATLDALRQLALAPTGG